MKINVAGKKIVKWAESLRLDAYLCPAGVWTIGYGHTGDVKKGDRITEHQADVILDHDLERFEKGVAEFVRNANENQFSAIVSFAFNVGIEALKKSTLLREHNAGRHALAAAEFHRWNRGGGKVLPGLVKRREAEARLYLEPTR